MSGVIDFSSGRVTLVTCGVDMRFGLSRLADIAREYLFIDIDQGNDYVVFLSKSRSLCKIIHSDEKGTTLITRRLRHGKFEQFLSKSSGPALKMLTKNELEDFLNGETIFVRRQSLVKG